ncbi:MAG TPA: 30S ribosomal protein S24e [Archaeoglobaceae archaeon]|nr:30S ribosomal protein S24e [Archaeoglobaceae archaeon]
MEIIVEKEHQNPLLRRKEIRFRLEYDAQTPSRSDVRKKLAGLFSANVDNVIIEYIRPEFGKPEAKCYAKIYDSPEDLKSIEAKHIIRRNIGETGEEREGTKEES